MHPLFLIHSSHSLSHLLASHRITFTFLSCPACNAPALGGAYSLPHNLSPANLLSLQRDGTLADCTQAAAPASPLTARWLLGGVADAVGAMLRKEEVAVARRCYKKLMAEGAKVRPCFCRCLIYSFDLGTMYHYVPLVILITHHLISSHLLTQNLPQLTDRSSPHYQKPHALAVATFSYYQCFRCRAPYAAGRQQCEANAEAGAEIDRSMLLCGKCSSPAGGATTCPKHGPSGIQYKCRFCCSPATWFCWGTTRFCESCHKRQVQEYITRCTVLDLPQCAMALEYERERNDNKNIKEALIRRQQMQNPNSKPKKKTHLSEQEIDAAFSQRKDIAGCTHKGQCALGVPHPLNGLIEYSLGCAQCFAGDD